MKKLLLFAFALLALSSCKKEEPAPPKRVVGFKFTCPRAFDAKATFDGETKEIKGDSGTVYMEFEYVEGNEASPVHTFQTCITATHNEAVNIKVMSGAKQFESGLVGPGTKCNPVETELVY